MSDAMKRWSFLVSGLCLVTLVACDGKKTETKAVDQAAVESAAQQQAAAPGFPIQGTAKEVLQGNGYTYVLIAAEKGDKWVAMPGTDIAVGDACTVAEGQVMQNFPSKSLDRTFDEIVFAPGLVGKTGDVAAKPAAVGSDFSTAMQKEGGAATQAEQAAPGSGKAVVPFVELKVAKASGENAFTVADVFSKAASLNGKKVKIQGQVVKFSPQIMGKNWLHLQDGTGDPSKNTHDLVVTSADKAEKGEIVTVQGVLVTDKDFGAGYKYAVIVEDVTVTR
jgi:hypothetical protein